MDRPFLAFHIHSRHVPGHLHLLGGKYFRGSEKSRSEHCRILKKSSSCAAHACLLNGHSMKGPSHPEKEWLRPLLFAYSPLTSLPTVAMCYNCSQGYFRNPAGSSKSGFLPCSNPAH